jgi:hypothetical protein
VIANTWIISVLSSTRTTAARATTERRLPEGRVVARRCDVDVPRCVDLVALVVATAGSDPLLGHALLRVFQVITRSDLLTICRQAALSGGSTDTLCLVARQGLNL